MARGVRFMRFSICPEIRHAPIVPLAVSGWGGEEKEERKKTENKETEEKEITTKR